MNSTGQDDGIAGLSQEQIDAGKNKAQDYEEEDRISKLPDDILVDILDRIPRSEAVRTCVLSKRWRHLIDIHSVIILSVAQYLPADSSMICTLDDLERANASLVKATERILGKKSQSTIRHLGITFYLTDESIDIVRAMDKAMAHREVADAKFNIMAEMVDKYCTDYDMLTYGRRFMTLFKAFPRAFSGLTDLRIHSLRLGEADIPNVLNACKKLKNLRLQNCDAGIRSVLQIEHSQLDELSITACDFETIELNWLPKLTHLTCRSWLPSQDNYPLTFGYVPQLRFLILSNIGSTIHKIFKLSEFLANVNNIKALELNFLCEKIWIQPEAPRILAPMFQKLQVVSLRYIHEQFDLTWTMFFLEAAPHLRELYIQVWEHTCYSSEEEPDERWEQILQKTSDHLNWEAHDGSKHYNLRTLAIEGFEVQQKFTGYIKLVVEAAVNLKVLSLLESGPCPRCQFQPKTSYPRTNKERDLLVKQILGWRASPIKIEIRG
ncbi:hypothetical protein ACP4OV_030489 [Aristida adscensionis]